MLLHPHTSAVWCRSSESDGSSFALAAARQVCNGPPIPGRSASSAAHRGLLLAHFTADLLQITAHGTSAVLVGAMLAMVLGTLLEGTLMGYAQAHVLTARLPSRRARSVDRRHIGTLGTQHGSCAGAVAIGSRWRTPPGRSALALKGAREVAEGFDTWEMTRAYCRAQARRGVRTVENHVLRRVGAALLGAARSSPLARSLPRLLGGTRLLRPQAGARLPVRGAHLPRGLPRPSGGPVVHPALRPARSVALHRDDAGLDADQATEEGITTPARGSCRPASGWRVAVWPADHVLHHEEPRGRTALTCPLDQGATLARWPVPPRHADPA